MFRDLWKPLTRSAADGHHGTPAPAVKGSSSVRQARSVYSRHSNGLEQFFGYIRDEQGLTLLDLSGASQANIGFITSLGHKLYSEDLFQTLDTTFGSGDFYANQCAPERVDALLNQSLNFPPDFFDGVLVWDVLEFLAPPLLKAVADRLHFIVKPRSYLLAMFHTEETSGMVAAYSYRISDAGTLLLTPRGMRQPAQVFNNRAVERLFQTFEAVKFFLTRDHLREVIVKR